MSQNTLLWYMQITLDKFTWVIPFTLLNALIKVKRDKKPHFHRWLPMTITYSLCFLIPDKLILFANESLIQQRSLCNDILINN